LFVFNVYNFITAFARDIYVLPTNEYLKPDPMMLEYYSKSGIGLIKIAPSVAHDPKGVLDLCIE